MPTRDEIYEKVVATLEDALGVDADEVKLDARLTTDLGAESIDFLDISFRLEKNFSIKIPKGELFPDIAAADQNFAQGGKVTETGIEELRKRLPHADIDAFAKDPKVENIMNELFTVNMIVKYLEKKLASNS